MHSISEIGTNVPAFLGKLWKMVEDPVTNDLIAWNTTGTSFVIKDEIRFARVLLPMYYKHNNMASFIRQLNMYGFHKIVSPEAGSMKLETPDEIQFTHPFFTRGHPYLLDNIKRKIGVKVVPGQAGDKTPQVVNKVLTDMRQIKGRQENMDSRLAAMKLENGALWRELSLLRQKHNKQQQIVNKLIQFLVTIVQQNHNSFSVKRKFHRMLQHHDKSTKQHNTDDMSDCASNQSNSPMGPVIHELDPAEALLETVVEEAESESPYFLNQSCGEIAAMADAELYKVTDPEVETIIGLPEDSFIMDRKSQEKNMPSTNPTSLTTSLFVPTRQQVIRPKHVKIITRKPKRNIKARYQQGTQPTPILLLNNQEQLQNNQPDIHIIKQQSLQPNKSRQKLKTQKPAQQCYQLKLLKNQPEQLQRNQQIQFQLQRDHQSTNMKDKQLTQEKLEQQPQPPTEPEITITFDSGGNIIPEVNTANQEPLYTQSETTNFDLPLVMDGVSAVDSMPVPVSQDLLIGSPIVLNDPLMTPKCEPVSTPIITPVSTPVNTPVAASPASNSEMQVACVEDSQVTSPSSIVTRSANRLSEMDNHLDAMQTDLDSLRELLRSEGISLDANALLGYFNDDPMSYNFSDSQLSVDDPNKAKENIGNELMAYNPSLFDLTDLIGNEWSLPSPTSDQVPPVEDSFAEVNTPQFVPHSPSFPTAAKKRKK